MQGMVLAALGLSLVACTCPPVVPVVERIPVPATLTSPCTYEVLPPTTNGEMLEQYLDLRSLLAECDTRMTAIRGLK